MASMLEKLGAMFEDDTTSVSISADVSVSEGSEVETVEEVQEYAEASDVVEEASQELEEATQQMEDTAEAAETAAELRANISQYGLNKQAAALIYQFYGIDKVGSFVTPSVESIDTVGRNYSAANQLMIALEEAEEGFKAKLKRAWEWIKRKAEELWTAVTKFVKTVGTRIKNLIKGIGKWIAAGVRLVIPEKVIRLIKANKLQRVGDKVTKLKADGADQAKIDEAQKECDELWAEYKEALVLDNAFAGGHHTEVSDKVAGKYVEADKNTIGKFLSYCWDIISFIPKKIGQFVDWIKARWSRVSSEVKSDMEAEKQKKDQEDAGKLSKIWTSMVRIMKTIFRFFFSWGSKAEKEAEKQESGEAKAEA